MADKKISELTELKTAGSTDEIAIVDKSGTPTTKKITADNLKKDKVAGPASAVDENIPVFDDITGKIIKDSGYNKSLLDALNTPLSDEGLILYLPFDENTGTTAYDKSHNGYNGTFKGAGEPAWCPGYKNTAVDFDGVDDYVDCGNGVSLQGTGAITVEAWIKLDAVDGAKTILNKYTSLRGWILRVNNGVAEFIISTPSVTSSAAKSGIVAGNWYHIVGVWNGSDVISIYVNGVKGINGSAPAMTDSGGNLKIGMASHASSNYFDGKIDEPRVFTRALSANEVMARYLKG